MNLPDAIARIEKCIAKMNTLYGETLFDEWGIVSLAGPASSVLAYRGARPDEFRASLAKEAAPLIQEAGDRHMGPGDFEFARFASGTRHDAGMVLGDELYLLCNHTQKNMQQLRESPLWISAQAPFVSLSEAVRANPLVVG